MKSKFKFIKYLLILTSAFILAIFLLLALGRMDETLEVQGEVSLWDSNLVFSPDSGFIDSVYVKEEQFVREGQLLALIRKDQFKKIEAFSPIEGLIFSEDLSKFKGRYVNKGEVLMVIADPHQMGFRALIPEKSIPLVKEELEATLFIDAFPHQRFGTFQGVVTSISSLPESKGGEVIYLATLLIKKPYVESEPLSGGQRLLLKPGMRGQARIITRSNMSILKKLFNRFLS
jgi:multidrug efflux pump subunit AcrA (membrane-fusion protein)